MRAGELNEAAHLIVGRFLLHQRLAPLAIGAKCVLRQRAHAPRGHGREERASPEQRGVAAAELCGVEEAHAQGRAQGREAP